MDWRKATRTVFHEGLGIEKCPAEVNDRDEALREAIRIAHNRRAFFRDVGKAASALGLYALTVDTPWHKAVVNTAKSVFKTATPSLDNRTRYYFSGSTSKTTESFYIPTRDWRISFEVTGDSRYEDYSFFIFFVYPEDFIIFVETGGLTNRFGQEYTVVHHGPGNYYLRVASSYCYWRITVTAPP